MRRDIRVSQPALDGRPQQSAAGLIDTTDHDGNAFQRRRNGRWQGNVNLPSASAMTNNGCGIVRSRQTAAGDDDAARIVRSKFGRYSAPDHAITTDNEDVLIIQAVVPSQSISSEQHVCCRVSQLENYVRRNGTG